MQIDEIAARLDEFNTTFKHIKDDYEDFDDEIVAIPRMSHAEYQDFLARRAATEFGGALARFHDFLVLQLLNSYASGTDEERQQILTAFSNRPFAQNALWPLLKDYQWRLQKSPAGEQADVLRTLLLLAILGEDYLDQPETAMILTNAWREAEHAGLEPTSFFKEAAALAGRLAVLHGRSARDFLANFEPYQFGAS